MNTYQVQDLMGSRSKVAVLRVLSHVSVPMSIRQIAAQARVSHVAAATALDELVAVGVVGAVQAGRSRVHWLERRSLLTQQLIEPVFASEAALSDLALDRLQQAFGDAYSAVLYGSRARGDNAPRSDFDVLVVQPDQQSLAALMRTLERSQAALEIELGAAVSILGYTVLDAQKLSERGDNFMTGVMEDGVVLCGMHPREWGRGKPESDK